jgi:hypothetical protein
MSLIGLGESNLEGNSGRLFEVQVDLDPAFSFVPAELLAKCRDLVESYHAIHGYTGFPDMVWDCDARDFIASQAGLSRAFKKACKSKEAKRAKSSYLEIGTLIVSLEILARDFVGWGERYPTAQRKAKMLMSGALLGERNWLMDRYLYPTTTGPQLGGELAWSGGFK